jgi:hypothetical protein
LIPEDFGELIMSCATKPSSSASPRRESRNSRTRSARRHRARNVSYLRERVEPYTKLDELLLYPEVATRLGDPLVAASMNYDHLAIRQWIERIATVDITDTALLQHVLLAGPCDFGQP